MPAETNPYFVFIPNTLTGKWTVKRADDNWVVASGLSFDDAVKASVEYFESLPF